MLGHVKVSNADEMAFRLDVKGKQAGSRLEDALDDIAAVIQSVARGGAPMRTGNLRSAIKMKEAKRAGPKGRRAEVFIDTKQAPYGVWVNDGTGIYGSKHKKIYAKPGNMLVFEVGGRKVVTRSVKGQKGQHFMENAFDEVNRTYAPARIEKLLAELADF